jgi:hypothetical protein
MYLLATRPDLTYYVCLVARYMERPTKMHSAATKRIWRYLKGTMNFGIMYKSDYFISLTGWSNFDYVGDTYDRKSISNYVFMIGNGAISWSFKKQSIVTLSTTKVEFLAAASCSC